MTFKVINNFIKSEQKEYVTIEFTCSICGKTEQVERTKNYSDQYFFNQPIGWEHMGYNPLMLYCKECVEIRNQRWNKPDFKRATKLIEEIKDSFDYDLEYHGVTYSNEYKDVMNFAQVICKCVDDYRKDIVNE